MTRVESATGWWEFVRRPTDRRLADLVAGHCGYRETARRPLRRQMAANSLIPLILSFGPRLDVVDKPGGEGAGRSYVSFVAGLHPGPTLTQVEGSQFGLQVYLTPLGAYQILGIPGAALAHRVVELEAVAPGLAGSLPDHLASLPTWAERFAVVDDVLLRMADRGPAPDPLVSWMWRQLQDSGGRITVAELVRKSGWSHRHVTARFREQVVDAQGGLARHPVRAGGGVPRLGRGRARRHRGREWLRRPEPSHSRVRAAVR